ncbi:SRPBCC domain-containing protein [Mechercharimyces sp. CAU 1602]|uniref:SRPBCC family protein n=1 Tax=Mechercharimyces sp. CAU 1602 TaxID=2973933 RepID=UPI002163828A|nr:SRPBCC domain-containing protein [Mechercharimyces sp. CAU 1602]MCS1351063.1 SRPBCC domain-containing protein [Mechercharimyces sp. CAU 1602]
MSAEGVKKEMVSSTDGQVLTIEYELNAPKKVVFDAYSNSENLASWWGPKGWKTENLTFEFKPNGVWHYCMRCVDQSQGEYYGQESRGKAVYQEIVPDEKIIYTDSFVDKEGNPLDGMPEIFVAIHFEDDGDGTKMTMRSEFASSDILQQMIDMGIEEGCASQFSRLDDFLETKM